MTFKRFIFVLILVGIAVSGFTRGVSDDDWGECVFSYGGKWGRGTRYAEPPETQNYSGTFGMEDDKYPYLVTTDGQKYYLIPGFPIPLDLLPTVDDALEIEAFLSDISPIHLVVTNATVNGVDLNVDSGGMYDPGWANGYRDRHKGRGWRNNRGWRDDRDRRGDGTWR